jgi:hypothetical protein
MDKYYSGWVLSQAFKVTKVIKRTICHEQSPPLVMILVLFAARVGAIDRNGNRLPPGLLFGQPFVQRFTQPFQGLPDFFLKLICFMAKYHSIDPY